MNLDLITRVGAGLLLQGKNFEVFIGEKVSFMTKRSIHLVMGSKQGKEMILKKNP